MAASGAWVAYDPGKVTAPVIESAAESALWAAEEHGLKVVFWPFGTSLDEAIAEGVKKARPATRSARAATS